MSSAAVSSSQMTYSAGRAGRAVFHDYHESSLPLFRDGNNPSFHDVLDVLNPLQHIPIISTIYRKLTGDQEGAVADVLGGALYGGPLGVGAAIADLSVRESTGKSVADNAIALVTGEGKGATPAVAAKTAIAAQEVPAAPAKTAAAAANANGAAVAAAEMPPAAAPAPRPVVSAGPLQPVAARSAAVADGPQQDGDYLVFGAPVPARQASAAALPSAATADAAGAPLGKAAMVTAMAGPTPGMAGNPSLNKGLPVFAGNGAPATSLPPIGVANAASAAPTLVPAKLHPVPPRTGPAAPPAVLPPPTTGPGALPGGQSMAVGLQPGANAQGFDPRFVAAFNSAMDKYQKAARLGAGGAAAPATGAPDGAAAAPVAGAQGEPAI